MQKKEHLKKIVQHFPNTKILVIGDVMIDRFIWGKVSRISPEAPVPVVEVTKETMVPGGAGNVVNNITSLGGYAYLIGVIGRDGYGKNFLDEMQTRGVDCTGIVPTEERPTTTKTRIIAHHQQVVRVDRENKSPISQAHLKQLIAHIKEIVPHVSAVVISDYGKGVISPTLFTATITVARAHKKPVLVDPKVEHFQRYRRVTCITPNLNEAMQGMHWHHVETQDDVEELGEKIMKTLSLESLIITQGEKGMTIFEKNNVDRIMHIPTMAQEVFDVTGAGDTVISTLAMCCAHGVPINESAYIANCAAGIVVGKLGTATTTPEEIIARLR